MLCTTLLKSLREESAEFLDSLIVRNLRLVSQTTLDTRLYALDLEWNVTELILYTRANVRTDAV